LGETETQTVCVCVCVCVVCVCGLVGVFFDKIQNNQIYLDLYLNQDENKAPNNTRQHILHANSELRANRDVSVRSECP
jgi:uncharacterized protein HemX